MPHAAPLRGSVRQPSATRAPPGRPFPLAAPRQASRASSMDARHAAPCQGTGTPNGTSGKEIVTRKQVDRPGATRQVASPGRPGQIARGLAGHRAARPAIITTVDVTAARRIICEQDEAVRGLLGPLLADVGHQALAIAFRDDSPTSTPARHHVHEVRKRLIWQAEELIEGHGLPDRVITAPDDLHPPRNGHLKEAMLARLVAEDLAAGIDAGRALEASLTRREQISPAAPDWVDDVNEVLAGLEPEVRISSDVFFGLGACKSPLVPAVGAVALCRAYLVLALAYLEEVQERMPDYAEASGQAAPEPPGPGSMLSDVEAAEATGDLDGICRQLPGRGQVWVVPGQFTSPLR